jgi:hypothetical protein
MDSVSQSNYERGYISWHHVLFRYSSDCNQAANYRSSDVREQIGDFTERASVSNPPASGMLLLAGQLD